MNKQRKGSGSRGIEWTDFTWNPVRGCQHGCRWVMPDGSIAECYAETIAERVAQQAYPQGFEHHYWNPHVLGEPLRLKTPARIFLDSMSDLMGHWVPAAEVEQVLDVCRQAHWHQFQLLTKAFRSNSRAVNVLTLLDVSGSEAAQREVERVQTMTRKRR